MANKGRIKDTCGSAEEPTRERLHQAEPNTTGNAEAFTFEAAELGN